MRDVFLSRRSDDVDLTTDAPPERVLEITGDWADKVWLIGIEFGTVGLRKGGCTFEITTYRSESYGPKSRKPAVRYGTSLEEDLARRDFTINAMAARLPVAHAPGGAGFLPGAHVVVHRAPVRQVSGHRPPYRAVVRQVADRVDDVSAAVQAG